MSTFCSGSARQPVGGAADWPFCSIRFSSFSVVAFVLMGGDVVGHVVLLHGLVQVGLGELVQ